MKNVYDIKREKNLNFILSDKYVNNASNTISKKEMAVVIHMHYVDTVESYFKYIANIPEDADVYITVSDKSTKKIIEEYVKYKRQKNCIVVDKNNRGRDISALLVACRTKILEYKYVCFIHDKKEKNDYTRKDTHCWVEGLWENTIGSMAYIYNIKELFDKNNSLGVLSPPNLITGRFSNALINTWFKNLNLTKKLAEELGLICDISEDKPPISLGTVFWCRVDALRKLFSKEWAYEDFPEEPLPDDGTINHAIERILAYVAQDAGYLSGIVMTDTYAGKQFEYRETILRKAFSKLGQIAGIGSVDYLFHYDEKSAEIKEFCDMYPSIYIFGAGLYGNKCLLMMKTFNKEPQAFLVSDGERIRKDLNGIPILELSEAGLDNTCGIILAVSSKYIGEIRNLLAERGLNNFKIFIDN